VFLGRRQSKLMKENLNKNILTVLTVEILSFLIGLNLGFIDSSFFIFWLISTLIINTIAVYLLAKYKTKLYLLTIIITLLIIFIPLLGILYAISKIQC
jgi:hypothetical protein